MEKAGLVGRLREKMLRPINTCAIKTSRKRVFTLEQFSTALCEMKAIVNPRYLMCMYAEHDEPDVVAPFHFFSKKKYTALSALGSSHGISTRTQVLKIWKRRGRAVTHF